MHVFYYELIGIFPPSCIMRTHMFVLIFVGGIVDCQSNEGLAVDPKLEATGEDYGWFVDPSEDVHEEFPTLTSIEEDSIAKQIKRSPASKQLYRHTELPISF